VSITGDVHTAFWHTSQWFTIRDLPSLNPYCARPSSNLCFTFCCMLEPVSFVRFPSVALYLQYMLCDCWQSNIKISFHTLPQP